MAAAQRIGHRISSTIFLEGPISQNKNIINSSYYFFPGGLRSTRRVFQAFSGPSSEAFRWLCQVEDIFMSSKGPLRRSGPSQSSEGPLKYSEKPFKRSKGPLKRSDSSLKPSQDCRKHSDGPFKRPEAPLKQIALSRDQRAPQALKEPSQACRGLS